jgi:hypothetical protein
MTAPVLSLAEAAKASGVSESTIRRKRPELLAAGATQTSKGWAIPVPALIELGLMSRTSAPDTVAAPDSPPVAAQGPATTPVMPSPTDTLVEALREKLADAEKRAAVAEAIAQERERIIEAQAQTLRMITAGPAPALQEPATATEGTPPAAPGHPAVPADLPQESLTATLGKLLNRRWRRG